LQKNKNKIVTDQEELRKREVELKQELQNPTGKDVEKLKERIKGSEFALTITRGEIHRNVEGVLTLKQKKTFQGMGDYDLKEYLDVNKGRNLKNKTGVQLNIPYEYSIKCSGNGLATCNAEVQVQARPIGKWTVKTVMVVKGVKRTTSWMVNPGKIDLKIEPITCSGKCNVKGKILKGELGIDVSVDMRGFDKFVPGRVDGHMGELELTFTPKYCDELEVEDKNGYGEVVKKITVRVDI